MLEDLIITEVTTAATMYNGAGAHRSQSCRPCWGIVYRFEGQTVYRTGGKTVISDASRLTVLPKGCAYEWECRESGRYFFLQFNTLTDPQDTSVFTLPVESGEALLSRLRNIEKTHNLRQPHYRMKNVSEIYTILLSLIRHTDAYSAHAKALTRAVEYMAAHTDRTVSNEELAKMAGLSVVYFRKLFTQRFGRSPIAYHQHLRMRKACEMLRADGGSVSDIAAALGYPNVYDFSRAFKKHMGLSPSQYRNQ